MKLLLILFTVVTFSNASEQIYVTLYPKNITYSTGVFPHTTFAALSIELNENLQTCGLLYNMHNVNLTHNKNTVLSTPSRCFSYFEYNKLSNNPQLS